MQERNRGVVFYKRVTWLCAVITLALLWIALDTWLGLTRRDVQAVKIPHLVGMQESELPRTDWLDVEVEYRYDETTPEGIVLAQTPRGGADRKISNDAPTCKLRVVVSLGRERVRLPDVVGQDVHEAIARLRACGVRVETEVRAGKAPSGRVLGMSPTVGTEVLRGATVTLTVSAGETTQTVRVPELRGLSRAEALMQLWLSGLNVGEVVEIDATAPMGEVVRQSHQPGTVVMRGTKIVLYVSGRD